jgi:predicted transcriptional regulator
MNNFDLNRNELEVMRIAWDNPPLKPGEFQEQFGWEIENATLRSVLRGLVERGILIRKKVGKAYFYRAKVQRSRQLRQFVKRMADVFSGGSTADLIIQLLRQEELSKQEIEELKQLAEEKETEAQKTLKPSE